MPFSVVVASAIKIIESTGAVMDLTLPGGVWIDPLKMARFAVLDRNVIIVNAVSQPVWIDAFGNLRNLVIRTPAGAPTMAAGAAGALTGTFRCKVSFVIKDDLGNDLAEGPLSIPSTTVTVAAQKIVVSNIPTSGNTSVNCRRVYRTTAGPGEVYFEWFDLDDNTTTTFTDDAPDAAISLLPAPDDLGSAPARLTLATEYRGRVFGVSSAEPDYLRFSADGKHYAWPASNSIPVRPLGRDRFGVSGFMPRRDELGVGRRDYIWKLIGNDETDFRMVKLVEGTGIQAPDSIIVTRDVARWLAADGVYEWDAAGVRCISDDDVKPWFTTDDYFERAYFPDAFSRYNPIRHAYELFLVPAGGSSFTRWVSYDIARKKWLGPHKTAALTPSSAGVILDSDEIHVPVVGGADGYVYATTPGVFRDGVNTAIDFDAVGAFHTGGAPDIEHFWGLISILSKIQGAGTLELIVTTGGLDAIASATINHDMTTGRQKLRRGGVGRLMQMRLRNNELDAQVEVYGYELPFHELGRR
jgi:hypothetical protein